MNKTGISFYNSIADSYILVDLTSQELSYYLDGQRLMTAPIISGMNGYETPTGFFKVDHKERHKHLEGCCWKMDVEYWIAFYKDLYGIHDALNPPEHYLDSESHKAQGSHGCVRMKLEDIATLYEIVEEGTIVIIQQ